MPSQNRQGILDLLKQGVAQHQLGELELALQIYRQVLQMDPKQPDALHLLGFVEYQKKNYANSIDCISQAIVINPTNAIYYSSLGNSLYASNLYDEAIAALKQAIQLKPDFAEAFNTLGNCFYSLKQMENALESYNKAVEINPAYAEAWNNKGAVLHSLSWYPEAITSYSKALAIRPQFVEVLNNIGNTYRALQQMEQALSSYEKAIALKTNYSEAIYNRATVLADLKRHQESIANYNLAISIKPNYFEAFNNRGIAQHELGEFEDALHSYNLAIEINPNYSEAFNNRGNSLHALKKMSASLESYNRAIELNPQYAEALQNCGVALSSQSRFEEASECFKKAINFKPNLADTYNSLGSALQHQKKNKEALKHYDKAISLNPGFAEAFNNRGRLFKDMYRIEDAFINYRRAIELNPEHAETYFNLGNLHYELKQLEEALDCYSKVLQMRPDFEFAAGLELHLRLQICDWHNFDDKINRIKISIVMGQAVTYPFPALGFFDDPALHFMAAQIFNRVKFPQASNAQSFYKITGSQKIRLAYYSADFYNHATSYLMAELFESHNFEKFEIIGFSFGPIKNDLMSQRISKSFFKFYEVSNLSDYEIAKFSRSIGIDVAIDLKGYTQGSRPGIFAERCAPIQINYLGYPGSMAADFIDYIIADNVVIPIDARSFYSEKLIFLPNCYQVNDSQRKVSNRVFTKLDQGLPETGFIFCCFNNSYKILPEVFASWMSILKAVGGSVLWLLEDNPTATKNLRLQCHKHGVDPNRLVFAARTNLPDHLARHALADLFLDTFPYNAHTTASDALWANLPVLTRKGKSFASRVASSLLNALNLQELITNSEESYIASAINLATYPTHLKLLKEQLIRQKGESTLFDGVNFAKHLEHAIQSI